MKLFRVSRPERDVGYDEFDSFIVAAEASEQATTFHPRGEHVWRMMTEDEAAQFWSDQVEAWLPMHPNGWLTSESSWPNPAATTAEHVGEALPGTIAGTVILASFNAG